MFGTVLFPETLYPAVMFPHGDGGAVPTARVLVYHITATADVASAYVELTEARVTPK